MGTVYRKTITRALPEDAEIFTRKGKRFARWKPPKGRTRIAPVTLGRDGSERLLVKASTYVAKHRDGTGRVVEKPTRCRDEGAARSVLAELERRAELVKANVLTVTQDAVAEHQGTALDEHVTAYLDHQTARGLNRDRIDSNGRRIRLVARECRFSRLADLNASALERWLVTKPSEGMSPGNLNEYRQAMVGFANWCVRKQRLATNPFAGVPKADVRMDRRRQRRALTEEELRKLLDAARRRPLLEALTVRHGPEAGKAVAKIKCHTRKRLERLGQERALIYKTLVLTGLRKGELASLTVGQLELDGDHPHAILNAADEKNRKGSTIPLRRDLVVDLSCWLDTKLRAAQEDAGREGAPIPVRLPADTPFFDVPKGLIRIFDRDLELAGIDKEDDRGRTLDIHALRHTFGTHLSKAGVAPRTAQAAMRHSTIDLTMNVYTDPRLLDVAGALEKLPALPLEDVPEHKVAASAVAGSVAPVVAPTPGHSGSSRSTADKMADSRPVNDDTNRISVTSTPDTTKTPVTTGVTGGILERVMGVGPTTTALATQCSTTELHPQNFYRLHPGPVPNYGRQWQRGQAGPEISGNFGVPPVSPQVSSRPGKNPAAERARRARCLRQPGAHGHPPRGRR